MIRLPRYFAFSEVRKRTEPRRTQRTRRKAVFRENSAFSCVLCGCSSFEACLTEDRGDQCDQERESGAPHAPSPIGHHSRSRELLTDRGQSGCHARQRTGSLLVTYPVHRCHLRCTGKRHSPCPTMSKKRVLPLTFERATAVRMTRIERIARSKSPEQDYVVIIAITLKLPSVTIKIPNATNRIRSYPTYPLDPNRFCR